MSKHRIIRLAVVGAQGKAVTSVAPIQTLGEWCDEECFYLEESSLGMYCCLFRQKLELSPEERPLRGCRCREVCG